MENLSKVPAKVYRLGQIFVLCKISAQTKTDPN